MINLDDLEGFDNLEDLNKEFQKRVNAHNESGVDDFDGLTPMQMGALQIFPEGAGPLNLNKLSEVELKECPLLVKVRLLIDKMKGGKELKLTKTGALSTKLVKEIYALRLLKNEGIENGITKLYKESDAEEISITRILLEISSLAKKRNGKLSLTKTGEKHAEDGNYILKEILSVLFYKFNWGYYDGYDSEAIGRINPAFSLFLLKKYGSEMRSPYFYAGMYFQAFPQLMEEGDRSFRCYSLRTFQRYFRFMGFVQVKREDYLSPHDVKKTEFFEKLFSIDQ
ncbi:hypothetical protein [Christiangramia forsetii]|uniref:Uncharacterized protein n=2 Tax=Christiangramia forsetii TaxID=411153 RepID=A0M4H9_CHRFK|nr:hypothetical protein [Christiangramia forsetii]GGG23430.1 hypothetical protein GCM10011532_03180 [Christiangramia forsetii]CAL67524.1 conserved hypothetical protein [Christiangramia forsetii KT0803]